jgi:ketosteroid isomerase-like protein
VNEPENPIMTMLNAYKAAVLAKDVDAFVALYDRNVRVFDMWNEWSYEGLEAWRGMATAWFGALGDERVAVDVDGVETIVGRDVAVGHAFVTYKGLSAEGKPLRAMRNRLTWTLTRDGDAWKIAHEHTSAPVDFGTSKLIFSH